MPARQFTTAAWHDVTGGPANRSLHGILAHLEAARLACEAFVEAHGDGDDDACTCPWCQDRTGFAEDEQAWIRDNVRFTLESLERLATSIDSGALPLPEDGGGCCARCQRRATDDEDDEADDDDEPAVVPPQMIPVKRHYWEADPA